METPIKFIQQASTCINIPNGKQYEMVANAKVKALVKSMREESRGGLLSTIAALHNFNSLDSKGQEVAMEIYTGLELAIVKSTNLAPNDPVDLACLLVCKLTCIEWDEDKRIFKVSDSLQSQLLETDLPKFIHKEVFQHLPSKFFYVELSDTDMLCTNGAGVFVAFDMTDTTISFLFNTLVEGNHVCTTYTTATLPFDEKGRLDTDIPLKVRAEVMLETGESIMFDTGALYTFMLNFFLYLNAANKDVVYVEKKIKRKRKKQTVVTGKVKVGEAGFQRAATYTSKKTTRIRYVDDKSDITEHTPRKYSSHWRNAHWHHYWKKNELGEKELILHWVNRTYVKGNTGRNDIIRVHNVQ